MDGVSIKQLTSDYMASKYSLYKCFNQLDTEDNKPNNVFLQQEVKILCEEFEVLYYKC